MKRRFSLFVGIGVLIIGMCEGGYVFGSHGSDSGGHFWAALVPAVFNFLALFGVIFYFGRNAITQVFSKRALNISRTVQHNSELYSSTLAEYQNYEKLLEGLEQERQERIQEAQKEGERIIRSMKQSAQRLVQRYQEEATDSLLLETGEAKKRLMLDLLDLAQEKVQEGFRGGPATLVHSADLDALERVSNQLTRTCV